MIFDTHCHLNHEDLYKRIDEVILTAQNVGVKNFLVVGYDKNTSLLAAKIAKKYDFCYAAVGFHPTEIDNVSDEDFNEVMNLLDDDKVVAIGEIGLDYHWVEDLARRQKQQEWFIRQIDEANKRNKPIAIHNRDSVEDCLKILKKHTPIRGGIMHCYSGSVESMYEFMKCGMYISLGGPVTFKNAKTPKEVAAAVPLDRLLVETDSPYLAPHPLRGSENEPKNIVLVIEEIARLKDISKEEIETKTYENAKKLLGI